MTSPYKDSVEQARTMEGSLDERLAVMREACRVHLPEYDALLDAFAARLVEADVACAAPGVGERFADFALPDDHGRIVRLDTIRRDGPVVIAFLRGVWCSFCRLHLLALAEVAADISAAGGTIVAISPQKAFSAAQHREDAGATFALLCDPGGGLATMLGLTAKLDEALHARLCAAKIDLAAINGDEGWTVPVPATFVIDREGIVAARHVDPDPRQRMEPAAVLQTLAALGECSGST